MKKPGSRHRNLYVLDNFVALSYSHGHNATTFLHYTPPTAPTFAIKTPRHASHHCDQTNRMVKRQERGIFGRTMIDVTNAHYNPRFFSSVLVFLSVLHICLLLFFFFPVCLWGLNNTTTACATSITPLCIHCPAGHFLSFLFSPP